MAIRPRPLLFIPPNGFAGFAEQTLAVKAQLSTKGATRPRRKTRASATKKRKPAAPKRRARKTVARKVSKKTRRRNPKKKQLKRMVKGSDAARRHMKKLRNMRKK